jgi:glycosyltransferase involved in cell wall biosynthesis
MSRTLRTLVFSSLYPSSARPLHGIFVETRLRELLRSGRVEARVVAPVPWFPFKGTAFGEYGRFAATPAREQRHGIEVVHPRYLLPPRVGMQIAPWSMAEAAWPVVRGLIDAGFDFDLIDAHYYYPDGAAAARIARRLGKPLVVTARGTDLNLIPQFPGPRRQILRTAAQAQASVGVCRALMDSLAALGAAPAKLHVLRNGVDLQRFVPEGRADARRRLGLAAAGRLWVSVGQLVERKGHDITLRALARHPDASLALVGSGPEQDSLRRLAGALGLADRVCFAGLVPNEELKWWYSAADVSVLSSSREGWANVLLESMACGTPVVASRIWGTPEVVAGPAAGLLYEPRTPEALAEALVRLFLQLPPRDAVRAYAEGFSWQATTTGQLQLFDSILAR